jgi:hypothetical protein
MQRTFFTMCAYKCLTLKTIENIIELCVHMNVYLYKYITEHYLSRVTTKPTAQSDQDPCCSLSVSLFEIGLVSEQHGS